MATLQERLETLCPDESRDQVFLRLLSESIFRPNSHKLQQYRKEALAVLEQPGEEETPILAQESDAENIPVPSLEPPAKKPKEVSQRRQASQKTVRKTT